MKNMKFAILACGALGLVSLLMEFEMFKFLLLHPFAGSLTGLIMIGGFVVATVMGVMALSKPLQAWQAAVALAGFAAIAIKFKIWEALPHIGSAPTSGKLMLIADIAGIVVSAIALAKKEAQV